MDIEQMRSTWESTPEDANQFLSNDEINAVTKSNRKNPFIKILIPKIVGLGFYLFGALTLGVFFKMMSSTVEQVLGIAAILLLLGTPLLSLFAYAQYYKISQVSNPVVDSIEVQIRSGKQFLKRQKVVFLLNLLIAIILVFTLPQLYLEVLDTEQKMIGILLGLSLISVISFIQWRFLKRKVNQVNDFNQSLI